MDKAASQSDLLHMNKTVFAHPRLRLSLEENIKGTK